MLISKITWSIIWRQNKWIIQKEMSENPAMGNASPSKYAGIGAAITAELMIRLWFGFGVILATGVAAGLNYCNGTLTSSGKKMRLPLNVITDSG